MNLFHRLRDLVPGDQDDTDLPTCEVTIIASLVDDVQQKSGEEEVEKETDLDDDNDEGGVQEEMVSTQQARSALDLLRKYGKQQGTEDMLEIICFMEQQLNKQLLSSRKQKTTTDFFTQL
ncbi:hypothetical protein RRG08_045387 [Elysia crispata]|uniref:Uncharacterized protein n=1 Tax=Elysia crispata TaxID=231223 RepID=A0AAE0YB47_9GAST|nr:hypothetical protein RRG08_045387 [Elysia crispata]